MPKKRNKKSQVYDEHPIKVVDGNVVINMSWNQENDDWLKNEEDKKIYEELVQKWAVEQERNKKNRPPKE